MNSKPVFLSGLGMTCAAGDGTETAMENLLQGKSPGMVRRNSWIPDQNIPVGEVSTPLPTLENFAVDFQTRNNALALQASQQVRGEIEQVVSKFGPTRVGTVIGTTTSGMAEAEVAFLYAQNNGVLPKSYVYAQQELGSTSKFLSHAWGLGGPSFTVSTACSSSAKALATGRRLLRLGVCDAVLVGGVDTLCRFTLRGFMALGALSSEISRPFSPNRNGINIGEAAAFMVMRRDEGPVRVMGIGETSDAYNISAPLPGGDGARDAMLSALRQAGIHPHLVEYLNLHGTGTIQNDSAEALATHHVFPDGVPCSSTKPMTGHTLGAAGALEAGICWALLTGISRKGRLPPNLNDGKTDSEIPRLDLVTPTREFPSQPRVAMSNVFGFGGTNVSILLGAE